MRPLSNSAKSLSPATRFSVSPFVLEAAIVLLLCSFFAFFAISHARRSSATYDEATHLPAGYSYVRWHDYRMNPEHPPLVKKLAALPLLHTPVWPPRIEMTPQDIPGTSPSLLMAQQAWAYGLADSNAQWNFSHALLYGIRDEPLKKLNIREPVGFPTTIELEKAEFFNDADKMMFRGRLPIVLLGILLALLVFFWTREMYGPAGAILATALYCFDPNFIAHSSLVTTDVGITLFIFGAVYFLWRTCQRITLANVVLTLLLFALAFAAKFSAILLVPMFLLLGIGRILSNEAWLVKDNSALESRAAKTAAFAGLTVAALLSAFVVIWGMYDFRYSAAADPAQAAQAEKLILRQEEHFSRPPGHLPIDSIVTRSAAVKSLLKKWPEGPPEHEIVWAMRDAPVHFSGTLIRFARDYHLLPEAYLYGFAFAEMKSFTRPSFVLGEHFNRGVWYYFPVAFLVKTPLPALTAIAAALYFAIRRRETWHSRLGFIIIPAAFYFLFAIGSAINIGHRHLLPVYPFLFVLCGGLPLRLRKAAASQGCTCSEPSIDADRLSAGRAGGNAVFLALACGAIALSSLATFAPPWKPAIVYPHYLAYFNEIAGGPRNGYKWLVDSNLDWGQDLKNLKNWIEKNHITSPVNLCYFGQADPRFYQIKHLKLPGGYTFTPPFDEALDFSKLSGYVAISATNLQGSGPSGRFRDTWKFIQEKGTLVDVIGYSIFVYKIGDPLH